MKLFKEFCICLFWKVPYRMWMSGTLLGDLNPWWELKSQQYGMNEKNIVPRCSSKQYQNAHTKRVHTRYPRQQSHFSTATHQTQKNRSLEIKLLTDTNPNDPKTMWCFRTQPAKFEALHGDKMRSACILLIWVRIAGIHWQTIHHGSFTQ